MSITSYENFCKAFRSSDEEQAAARLLLMARDWMIRLGGPEESDAGVTDLDTLLGEAPYFDGGGEEGRRDALSRVLDETFDAFRAISQHMRENILRENVKLPVHKVREMNRYGMMWLSRRPGRTIREKASGTHSIMAVQRRMTLDTGENRLFREFLRQLADLLRLKLENQPRSDRTEEESRMMGQILSFLRSDELDEIRPWENLPPNNTLLSDQNYRKIWRGWNSLKELDGLILEDDRDIAGRVRVIFEVELLKQLRRFCRVPQLPVKLDYRNFQVDIRSLAPAVFFYDQQGRRVTMERERDACRLTAGDRMCRIRFTENAIEVQKEDSLVSYGLTERQIRDCIRDMTLDLCRDQTAIDQKPVEPVRCREAIVDLFALYPRRYDPENGVTELSGRLLYQRAGEGRDVYELPCDRALAICLAEDMPCRTIRSALEQGDLDQLSRLTHLLEKYLDTKSLTFLFPDVYTNLQLGLLYKAVRMAFSEARAFPRSVGAAFYWQQSEDFSDRFRDGDFMLSVDLVGDDLTITPLRGVVDGESRTLVWERHPAAAIPLGEMVRGQLDRFERSGCVESERLFRLFGFDGMRREAGRLSFLSLDPADGWDCFSINRALFEGPLGVSIDVKRELDQFLLDRRNLIGKSNVFFQFFSPFLSARGCRNQMIQVGGDEAIQGCGIYQTLQAKTTLPLWRDYLPKLSIKLLYGEFPLIQQFCVSARYGEKVRIPIDNIFTLPRGKRQYQFDLIQSETSKSTRFLACVRSGAFPLEDDTECRLELWYQYGSEDPFTLSFLPCDTRHPPFRQAVVSWLPRSQAPYPVDDLPVPEFPAGETWTELTRFIDKQGKERNFVQETADVFMRIARGYHFVDLRGMELQITGKENRRSFTCPCLVNGRELPVIFQEDQIEKVKSKPRIPDFTNMGRISFDLQEKTVERFRLRLSVRYGKVWTQTQFGYAHYENNWNYNGESVTVSFFSSEFVSEFDTDVVDVSFEVRPDKPDKFGNKCVRAVRVCDARCDSGMSTQYIAQYIRPGNTPADRLINGYVHVLFYKIYSAGKSVYDSDCPEYLREAFSEARDMWLEMYRNCGDSQAQYRIFNLMSLAARDLGDQYYLLACHRVENYKQGLCRLPDNIGYALMDCTAERELVLLDRIRSLPDDKVVCILSKAVWGHPDFIRHFPAAIALWYFDAAVALAGRQIRRWKNSRNDVEKKQAAKDLQMSLEYTLGVFRMRRIADERMKRELSLNAKRARDLYDWIERAIDERIKLRKPQAFTLSVSDKRQYGNIPDILYALLIYITGHEEGDTIHISGLDSEE